LELPRGLVHGPPPGVEVLLGDFDVRVVRERLDDMERDALLSQERQGQVAKVMVLFTTGPHARAGPDRPGCDQRPVLPSGQRAALAALSGAGLAEDPGEGRARVGAVP